MIHRFIGGDQGGWQVRAQHTLCGAPLPAVAFVDRRPPASPAAAAPAPAGHWQLQGVSSHLRYTTRAERTRLQARQPALGRPEARCAALIPLRKSPAWWALAQDERRALFGPRSRHTAIGLGALPAIARQLLHARDLGEPFDFLTWFEFAPSERGRFDRLLVALRASPEWQYVEREIEIHLERVDGA
ncbi:MAG TPA: chlorite dismutase family protein [Nevskiaceae bacterium]|nr:chlorite dismutase family protein [Nevskiaceae bacterium]